MQKIGGEQAAHSIASVTDSTLGVARNTVSQPCSSLQSIEGEQNCASHGALQDIFVPAIYGTRILRDRCQTLDQLTFSDED